MFLFLCSLETSARLVVTGNEPIVVQRRPNESYESQVHMKFGAKNHGGIEWPMV